MHGLIPGTGGDAWRRLPPSGPLARAIDLVGDRWALLIVYQALFHRTTRFGDFCRELGIPTNVLTRRLQSLVQAGVFERVDAPRGHSLHEYRLTPHGERLWPVLTALQTWGGESPDDDETAPELAHRDCGTPLVFGPACPTCKVELRVDDLSNIELRHR